MKPRGGATFARQGKLSRITLQGKRVFAIGETFAVYFARLGKSCLLLALDAKLETEAVATVGPGQAEADGSRSSPRPAVSKQRLLEIVSTGGRGDEFLHPRPNRLGLPFKDTGRMPSGSAGKDILYVERLDRMAVIGLGNRELIVKLKRRKHMDAGSEIVCVCICEGYLQDSFKLHVPHLFCPACALCPAVENLAHAWGQPLPTADRQKIVARIAFV